MKQMYDADYEEYLREEARKMELKEPATDAGWPSEFVTRDSGRKAQYEDGMQRDTAEGKPKFRLIWPKDVPYEDQLLYRVAMHYTRGGAKYGDRNWEKSCTGESLAHHEDALERHFHKFLEGVEDGEDHAAAIVWNVNAVLLTRRNIRLKAEKTKEVAMPDLQLYIFPYIGKDTASTGRYCQKQIWAGCYQEARMLFDKWYARQPYYNAPLDILEAPAVSTETGWDDGDELTEELATLAGGDPYVWVYQACTGTWLYKHDSDSTMYPESARSFRKLTEDFGPLKCTKGKYEGKVFDGA